ncbi:hypothetical protein CLF_109825 [Clonorchis sinensis]|uniref:Uncharacterized protein n=1 Tax=Clonorchis sinensis TaxID=79923 RepID=G7YSZ2_CLOSI|nr:hypothetical protein CLF_109825 [Clonorchis sinensis]
MVDCIVCLLKVTGNTAARREKGSSRFLSVYSLVPYLSLISHEYSTTSRNVAGSNISRDSFGADEEKALFPDSSDATGTESKTTGVGKKRNVFANLFGRNKSKHRGKHSHSHTHPPTPGSAAFTTAASLGAPEHEEEENNVTSPAPGNPASDIGTTEETTPITSTAKFDCEIGLQKANVNTTRHKRRNFCASETAENNQCLTVSSLSRILRDVRVTNPQELKTATRYRTFPTVFRQDIFGFCSNAYVTKPVDFANPDAYQDKSNATNCSGSVFMKQARRYTRQSIRSFSWHCYGVARVMWKHVQCEPICHSSKWFRGCQTHLLLFS